MARLQSGHDTNVKLCEILGIEPTTTTKIEIEFPADGYICAKIYMILNKDECTEIIQLVEKLKYDD